MNELVFIEPNKIDSVPYTTSDIIAECAKLSYRSVQRMIEKHQKAFETFGKVRFEITPLKDSATGQSTKIYHLNEEQATLLITFLKNTDPVVKFKIELVKQFYLMKNELMKRQVYREQLKPIRRELTDVIQADLKSNKWSYKQYTDLAYKAVIGKSAAQVRKDRDAKKSDTAIDYMTSQELEQITKTQYKIAVLIETGFCYHQIKDVLMSGQTVDWSVSK